LLGGGRNLLLESAQEATLMSVSIWQTKVKPEAMLFHREFHIDVRASGAQRYGFNRNSTLHA
jgi:hypothetical protein